MNRVLSFVFALVLTMAAVAVGQKETPPEGGKPRDFKLPERTSFTLENGLRVTMVPYGEIPKVTIYAVVRAGKINEAATQIWLSDLTGEMLKEGTKTRTSRELARDAARIGGSINVAVGEDRSFVSGDALAEYAPVLIELLGDVLRNPSFPASELTRIRNNLQRQLAVSQADPQTMTLEKFRKVLYGDHPRPISLLPGHTSSSQVFSTGSVLRRPCARLLRTGRAEKHLWSMSPGLLRHAPSISWIGRTRRNQRSISVFPLMILPLLTGFRCRF
jgi:hypothetical protein